MCRKALRRADDPLDASGTVAVKPFATILLAGGTVRHL
jgi:hypothetical protein